MPNPNEVKTIFIKLPIEIYNIYKDVAEKLNMPLGKLILETLITFEEYLDEIPKAIEEIKKSDHPKWKNCSFCKNITGFLCYCSHVEDYRAIWNCAYCLHLSPKVTLPNVWFEVVEQLKEEGKW